jgi:short-subunit dehydrogenase
MKGFKTALITGASSGIGEAFANALAGEGMDLILVARSEDRLRSLARQLAEVHSRRVEVVTVDLTHAGAAEKVRTAAEALKMPVDLLVNNAGFGTVGALEKIEAARERDEVLLNCVAVVDMTHAFLPGMLERGRGGIINVASLAAFQPLPYMSVYAATKAFVLSFTEGVRGEVRPRGIKVLCVCPGPVDTPFFEATGNQKLRSTVPRATMMTVDEVIAASLKAFKAGRGVVVPGVGNKLMASSTRFVPRDVLTAITARVMRR